MSFFRTSCSASICNTPPAEPQVAALAVRPAPALSSSPSYKEPQSHTHSSPGLHKEGCSRGGNLANAVPQTDRRSRSLGDSCCSEEPGSGIRSTDCLEPVGSRRSSGNSESRESAPTSPGPDLGMGVGRQGERKDAHKGRNLAAAQGSLGRGRYRPAPSHGRHPPRRSRCPGLAAGARRPPGLGCLAEVAAIAGRHPGGAAAAGGGSPWC